MKCIISKIFKIIYQGTDENILALMKWVSQFHSKNTRKLSFHEFLQFPARKHDIIILPGIVPEFLFEKCQQAQIASEPNSKEIVNFVPI